MANQVDPQKAEINQRIDEIALSLSNTPDGRFSLDDVTQQLATFYYQNADYRNAYAIAYRDVKSWDSGKRPKDGTHGDLFNADYVIPTGQKSERVFMSKARREHLLGWRKVEQDAFEARENVYNQRINYIDTRIAAWDVTKYSTLADLERDLFS